MFFNNHFSVIADRWVPNGPGAKKNVGRHESGIIKQEWHEPPASGKSSGKDYVELDDGRVFMRYDCYTPSSPYGWNEVDRKTISIPGSGYEDQDTLDQEIGMDEAHNISSEVAKAIEYAGMARMPFSWIANRELCDKSDHYRAHYLSLND